MGGRAVVERCWGPARGGSGSPPTTYSPAPPADQGWKTNGAFTNHALVSLLRRIASPSGLNLEPMLWQISVMRLFHAVLADPAARRDPAYSELLVLATRTTRNMFARWVGGWVGGAAMSSRAHLELAAAGTAPFPPTRRDPLLLPAHPPAAGWCQTCQRPGLAPRGLLATWLRSWNRRRVAVAVGAQRRAWLPHSCCCTLAAARLQPRAGTPCLSPARV